MKKAIAYFTGETMRYTFDGLVEREAWWRNDDGEIRQSWGKRVAPVHHADDTKLELYWMGPEAFAEAVGVELMPDEKSYLERIYGELHEPVVCLDNGGVSVSYDGTRIDSTMAAEGKPIRQYPSGKPFLDADGKPIVWTNIEDFAAAIGARIVESETEFKALLPKIKGAKPKNMDDDTFPRKFFKDAA